MPGRTALWFGNEIEIEIRYVDMTSLLISINKHI